MSQRKYFRNRINELEEVYDQIVDDVAALEELEEELLHRSTQRAKRLLQRVRQKLADTKVVEVTIVETLAPPDESVEEETVNVPKIDWESILDVKVEKTVDVDEIIPSKPINNEAEDLLNAWTILEALSPQSYKKPADLVIGMGSVANLRKYQEPWIKGEKSRPKCRLFYLVYLGATKLDNATEALLKCYQDKRVERPSVNGLAALGVVLLDKRGIPVPDTGLAVSSFGWAYARALLGRLEELKHWDAAEKVLKEGLEDIVYRQDRDGNDLPFSLEQAENAHQWLVENCGIPANDVLPPTFAIRLYHPFSRGEPETPLLNSFFLDDLQRARSNVLSNVANKALRQYLGIEKPDRYCDMLKHKSYIEEALQPKFTPLGRWPGRGRYPLVLLQQTAINIAMRNLKECGLISVNGPPGTGKTTLLRDIVAANVVERAKALYAFEDASDAFKHAGQMKLGNGFVHLYRLDDSLRGNEVLVASMNNNAVENISRELPLRSQVAEDLSSLNYFSTVGTSLSNKDEESWGLIAAVLGNSKNRSEFIHNVWWDEQTGLRKYFMSIVGQLDLEPDEDGILDIPAVVHECDPPEDIQQAEERWQAARKNFSEALKKAEQVIAIAQITHNNHRKAIELGQKLEQNEVLQEKIISAVSEQKSVVYLQKKVLNEIQQVHTEAVAAEAHSKSQKPGFFKRFFAREEWRQWKASHMAVLKGVESAQSKLFEARKILSDNENRLVSQESELSRLKSEHSQIGVGLKELSEKIDKTKAVCGGQLVLPGFWSQSHKDQQLFAPNFLAGAQKLRDDLFVAAIKLQKAFIDATAKQFRQNLAVFFNCLGGRRLPQDKSELLPHLWSTAFILTPVISTTFASVGRMLRDLPSESLGWLLIDEAGQALPQAAIGAIHRAKRVISVGDPLQIEPVVTLPLPLIDGISRYTGVDPDLWAAPSASVQALSDRANLFGATIPRDLGEIWIGIPLLVHRRCENPMFKISNNLAYANQMVHSTVDQPSIFTSLYGYKSKWFDVEGSAQEKWCPEEGEFVRQKLMEAVLHENDDPNIYVISPFRIVAQRMRQLMRQEAFKLQEAGITDPELWINTNIGTIHTFQGKEAKAVILLLGAPDESQNGARNWATSNVNLLNVAVSRAKQNFYVVGNKRLWSDMGHMKVICKYIE